MKDNKNLIKILLLCIIPILIMIIVIVGRQIITPTNEEIVDKLLNTEMYSCDVEYCFKNDRSEENQETKQFYRYDKGMRIEFNDYYKKIRVYNGKDLKVIDNDNEYKLDKNLDIVYPLSFLQNILCYRSDKQIEEIKQEWGDQLYLRVNIKYNDDNRYLNRGELYVDKKKRAPVMLKIFDSKGKERIAIKYSDFKVEKLINENLF